MQKSYRDEFFSRDFVEINNSVGHEVTQNWAGFILKRVFGEEKRTSRATVLI